MPIDQETIATMYKGLAAKTRSRLNQAVRMIVEAKESGLTGRW